MEVERISEDFIKPSSPTPLHLKTFKICLLDQFMTPAYVPMIFFYPNNDLASNDLNLMITKRSLLLKKSLSESLTQFYPLAGKLKDDISIDCNDEGAYYVNARVHNITLYDYLEHPHLTSMHKLLPIREILFTQSPPGSHVAMVQETTFACGGVAVGVSVSHMLMDGISASRFVKHWAAAATATAGYLPNFDASVSMFPQFHPFPKQANYNSLMAPICRIGKLGTRRFVFDESSLLALKAESRVENATRVEAVSALLMKCIMSVFKTCRSGIEKPGLSVHPVNLRRRATPPLSDGLIGNLIWSAAALVKPEETDLATLIWGLREAIKKLDSELVKKIQGDEGFFKLYEKVKEMGNLIGRNGGGVDGVLFSSWCNFGLYDINFGWGKPIWTSFVGSSGGNNEIPFLNTVVLMDGTTKKGMEAWVFLSEDELDLLDKDEHLLSFASLNPTLPFSL
ncbi:stemmadenine O-acetyltransferase-like [Mercurialis annua]|uniref:stemmadenine O-acetyltransferase-like n=1 Tax=Mercurialis annua TaxID=3986 RepID=UPI002160EE41|nr:stemmadenine O-acetyltransferase-like [Mercurialis annua]